MGLDEAAFSLGHRVREQSSGVSLSPYKAKARALQKEVGDKLFSSFSNTYKHPVLEQNLRQPSDAGPCCARILATEI